MSLDEFRKEYFFLKPFASAGTATDFRKLISWPLLEEIFKSEHTDCWLARKGKLVDQSNGRLSLAEALAGYKQGASIVVRHSEKSHPKLAEIAKDFESLFHDPVDVHLYVTPPGEEGFNWHYDVEEVFVIQSSGEKEFWLRQSKAPPSLEKVELPKVLDFENDFVAGEMRCNLRAGDWLYIPAGIWHKARAVSPSFHLSVGVYSAKRRTGQSKLT